jgi:hypothetical protein
MIKYVTYFAYQCLQFGNMLHLLNFQTIFAAFKNKKD